jgi:hypothetical protein
MVKTIVASFDDYRTAQRVARELVNDGFMACDIGIIAGGLPDDSSVDSARGAVMGNLVRTLTEGDIPEEHARHLAESVRRGGALVTVKADDTRADRVTGIMRANDAVDLDARVVRWRELGWEGWNPESLPYTREEAERERRLYGTHADPLTGLPLTSTPERDNERDSTIRR